MFGWFRKRRRREQIRLVKQCHMAGEYLERVRNDAISSGLRAPNQFSSIEEMDLETASGYLEDLLVLGELPSMTVSDALQMNKSQRQAYEQILLGRKAFAEKFGSASERLLSFDQQFTPNEGWNVFIGHFESRIENQQ